MGLAARVVDKNPKDEFRHMIHDEVDKWVDLIIDDVFEDGKTPTVMEISELFAELTGHCISDHFMHETFEEVGWCAQLADVIPSRQEIAQRCKSVNEGSWRPVLVVAADGAHVPTRA